MPVRRIADEPAFVLHSYDWSESSLILEVFCRRQGRVALVAKGAKKPSSNFRPVLLPLQPLLVTYTLAGDGTADIHTLKGAEWVGGHVMPTGDALLSGMYLNELLLRLLGRARDAGNAQVARVAHQGDLVDVDRQGGALRDMFRLFHKDCRSIMSWRVRSVGLPQWYCSKARSWGLSSAATGAQARKVAV